LFHTLSAPVCGNVVPPHPTIDGQLAGQSTLVAFGPPSLLSLSPDAAKTTVPAVTAASAAACMSAHDPSPVPGFHEASSAPQEIENTSQPSFVAARNPVAIS
jgi:hypothetical protein